MTQPSEYNRYANFTEIQSNSPSTPLPAASVDAELNRVKLTLDQVLSNLALIQRDDTALKNDSVGLDQLKSEVNIGFSAPTTWATTTNYIVNETVFQSQKFYICLISHTSGTFATDLAAAKWSEIADFTGVQAAAEAAQAAAETAQAAAETAATGAGTSATNAASSASAASTSATGAASSATAASGSATTAGSAATAAATSETNAGTSATNAASSASNAASSETAAASSATAAAASAATAAGHSLGQHTIWVPAGAMTPTETNGAEAETSELATNDVMAAGLLFDAATRENAQFAIQMPKSWDGGDIIAQFIWTHPATTTNFGATWGIEAVAFADGDAMDSAFGTAQETTDTGGTTNDCYISPETGAMTVGGSPGAEELSAFQVYRDVADGGDTMAVDAKLLGVKLHYTTDAATDD